MIRRASMAERFAGAARELHMFSLERRLGAKRVR